MGKKCKSLHTIFLKVKDREEIKFDLQKFFSSMDKKEVEMWLDNQNFIGFSYVHAHHLEMLFLDPKYIAKGYGRSIIENLIERKNLRTVDVNEQNINAFKFYCKIGFIPIKKANMMTKIDLILLYIWLVSSL